jgi:membrane fusion protein (multidrug efflux system)
MAEESTPPAREVFPEKTRRRYAAYSLLILCAVSALLYLWFNRDSTITSRYARVEGQLRTFPAPFSGRILLVPASEGQNARRGDLLLALDDAPLLADLAEAEAALGMAERGGVPPEFSSPEYREREADASCAAEQGRLAEEKAREALGHWTAEHARAMLGLRGADGARSPDWDQLVEEEARTRAQAENARLRLAEASRQRAGADASLRRLREDGGVRHSGPEAVELWRNRVARAEADRAAAKVLAPADGKVVWLAARPGQTVSRGDPLLVFASVLPESPRVTAVFDRGQMHRLRTGQRCLVRLDDGSSLDGVIIALLPEKETCLAHVAVTETGNISLYPEQEAEVRVRVR